MTSSQRVAAITHILARGWRRSQGESFTEKRLDVSGAHTPPLADRLTAGEVEVM
jgi:hypothetical protein